MLTQNQVLHGDCTQVLRSIPSASIDLVVTDPPYFVRYKDRDGRTIANDTDPASVLGAFNDLHRVLKPDTFCVSFYGWTAIPAFFDAWTRAGFKPVGHIVWHKGYASRRGFLNARHEQAYLLAKGRPQRLHSHSMTFALGNTAAIASIPPRKRSASSSPSSNPSPVPATSLLMFSRDQDRPSWRLR